jgi:hypothetical protein
VQEGVTAEAADAPVLTSIYVLSISITITYMPIFYYITPNKHKVIDLRRSASDGRGHLVNG